MQMKIEYMYMFGYYLKSYCNLVFDSSINVLRCIEIFIIDRELSPKALIALYRIAIGAFRFSCRIAIRVF